MDIEAKYIIVLTGVVALIAGFYYLNRYTSMRKWGIRAEGTIYDIVETRNNIHQTQIITGVYVTQSIERRMEIGFVDRSNHLNIQFINVTTSHYKYKKGDVINVLYEQNNPEIS